MQSLLDELERRDDLEVNGRLEIGPVAETIVHLADEGDYDLIIMVTHGRRGLSRLVLGSVAEQVVRLADCPVLTLRAPEESGRSEG
jgi:nucleotide-binding universal stress UspA family protein